MKPLFIICLMFSLSTLVSAQIKKDILSKGDNIIYIETSLQTDSSFIAFSKFLAQKGYSFESRDMSIGQIVINEKSYAGAFNYKLNILGLPNELKVRILAQVITLNGTIAWTGLVVCQS